MTADYDLNFTLLSVLRLKQPYTRDELVKDPVHSATLSNTKSQPGYCAGITWGVLAEDKTLLVWLIGQSAVCLLVTSAHVCIERDSLIAETSQSTNTKHSHPFMEYLDPLLADDPVVALAHFHLDPRPSRLYCDVYPTLEIFCVQLKEDKILQDHTNAVMNLTQRWHNEGRPYAVESALDPNKHDIVLYAIAYKSVEEHRQARKDSLVAQCLAMAQEHHLQTLVYGHIEPSEPCHRCDGSSA
ncbi:hypothetical protein EMMF5_005427 [Cystobasidiomycetes sp. EMM_F5]